MRSLDAVIIQSRCRLIFGFCVLTICVEAWVPWGCLYADCLPVKPVLTSAPTSAPTPEFYDNETVDLIDSIEEFDGAELSWVAPWVQHLQCEARPKTTQQQISVACIGDSVTAGVGTWQRNESYPAQLQRLLGSRFVVSNFGACGAAMRKQALAPYWKFPHFQAALRSNADVVIVMLGTNDANGDWDIEFDELSTSYKGDYIDMIQTLRSMPSQPIILTVSPIPVYVGDYYGINQTLVNDQVLASIIQDVNSEMGLKLPPIDAFEAVGGASLMHPDWVPDGIHPGMQGYTAIANEVKKAFDVLYDLSTTSTSSTVTTTTTGTVTNKDGDGENSRATPRDFASDNDTSTTTATTTFQRTSETSDVNFSVVAPVEMALEVMFEDDGEEDNSMAVAVAVALAALVLVMLTVAYALKRRWAGSGETAGLEIQEQEHSFAVSFDHKRFNVDSPFAAVHWPYATDEPIPSRPRGKYAKPAGRPAKTGPFDMQHPNHYSLRI